MYILSRFLVLIEVLLHICRDTLRFRSWAKKMRALDLGLNCLISLPPTMYPLHLIEESTPASFIPMQMKTAWGGPKVAQLQFVWLIIHDFFVTAIMLGSIKMFYMFESQANLRYSQVCKSQATTPLVTSLPTFEAGQQGFIYFRNPK